MQTQSRESVACPPEKIVVHNSYGAFRYKKKNNLTHFNLIYINSANNYVKTLAFGPIFKVALLLEHIVVKTTCQYSCYLKIVIYM